MSTGEMKRCELCTRKAQMNCASDQAILCWDCDARVHSANFLVARHSRNLLCKVCQGPTPWSASGAKLVPTASLCGQCVEGEADDGSGEEESEDEEKEEVEENQVVPWSPPPPPAEGSSSIKKAVSGEDAVVSGTRFMNDNAFRKLRSDENESTSSSLNIYNLPEGAAVASLYRRQTMSPRENQKIESGRVDACG